MIALRTAACALGIVFALVVATAVHASPAPDDVESDCSWAESGTTMIIGDTEYRCLCAMLTGPAGKRVLCRWYRGDKLPQEPKKKPAPKKQKPKPKKATLTVRVYPKPTVVG